MTVTDLIVKLQQLEDEGFGRTKVFYRHGASGDCGPLSTPHVTDEVSESGPFDLDEGEKYVAIYAGY